MRLRKSTSTLLTKASIFLALGNLALVWVVFTEAPGPSKVSAAPLGGSLVLAIMSYSCFSDAWWIRRAPTITLKLADAVVDLAISVPAGHSIVGFHPYPAVYQSCRSIAAFSPTGEQLAFVGVWREPWTRKLPQWLHCLEYGRRRPLARLDSVIMKIGKSTRTGNWSCDSRLAPYCQRNFKRPKKPADKLCNVSRSTGSKNFNLRWIDNNTLKITIDFEPVLQPPGFKGPTL